MFSGISRFKSSGQRRYRVLRARGRGYIRKQEGGDKLIDAIRRVLRSEIAVSQRMTERLLEKFYGRTTMDSPLEGLSDRELEVFRLIGQGKTMKEIADELHLTPTTVEVHRAHIREKLRITSAAELISYVRAGRKRRLSPHFCERTARMYATTASRSAGFKLARCDMLSTISGQSSTL
jgi:RNA polymerase sigma factor (sigma-70 family)